jgi:hypothetical protein
LPIATPGREAWRAPGLTAWHEPLRRPTDDDDLSKLAAIAGRGLALEGAKAIGAPAIPQNSSVGQKVRIVAAMVAFCLAPVWVAFALLNLATDPKREPVVDFAIRNLAVPAALLVVSVAFGIWQLRKAAPLKRGAGGS